MSSGEQSPRWLNIAGPLNGGQGEEASVVQQISLKQRSARLSFLGGRKQEAAADQAGEAAQANVEPDVKANNHRLSLGKVPGHHRQSIFRTQSTDTDGPEQGPRSRRASSVGKQSLDRASLKSSKEFEQADDLGIVKRSSVRKRLSLLKLGKKSAKATGTMRSLDEE